MTDEKLDEFRALFGELVHAALEDRRMGEAEFGALLREHLGAEPSGIPVVAEEVNAWDHANLQLGLEALLEGEGRSARLVGIAGGQKRFMGVSLSDMVTEQHYRVGSVEYQNLPVGPDRTHPCMLFGLVLLDDPRGRGAILVRRAEQHGPRMAGLQVEVLTAVEGLAAALLDELRGHMAERNVFRGQLLSFEQKMWGGSEVVFHERSEMSSDELILPEGLRERIERHAIGIGRRAEALRASGRHLKRGVLLHGPPGTGKSLTVRWLSSELPQATIVVLSGGALGSVGPVCRMARELSPSMVVLEDVDLVGEDRTFGPAATRPLLFELLDELDGMADDADVCVVLTTNRPDLLEPALAARPGRVDLAVELPLPDAECRKRLFRRFAQGLSLEGVDVDQVVARTEGVTASFFRELLRQAALVAAERGSSTVVGADLTAALDAMLEQTGEMTRILLGARAPEGHAAPSPQAWMIPASRLGGGVQGRLGPP